MYADFRAAVDFEGVCQCLYGEQDGVFGQRSALSGVIYCEDYDDRFLFRYASNPSASRPLESVCSVFPPEMRQAG